MGPYSWTYFTADDITESHPLHATKELWDRLTDIYEFRNVLPADSEADFAADPRFSRTRLPNLYGDASLPQMKGNLLPLDVAKEILEATLTGLTQDMAERFWLIEVYQAVLRETVNLSGNARKLAVVSTYVCAYFALTAELQTDARSRPTIDLHKRIIPLNMLRSGVPPPATTDLAIAFAGRRRAYHKFAQWFWTSLNPTHYYTDFPFAISFKAADTREWPIESNFQLDTFQGACFSVMESLAEEVGIEVAYPLPILLGVSTFGSSWRISAYTCDSSGEHYTWRFTPQFSSDSLLDIYRLIAVLKSLISTAQGAHLDWNHRFDPTVPPAPGESNAGTEGSKRKDRGSSQGPSKRLRT